MATTARLPLVDVVGGDAVADIRHFEPILVLQRIAGVVIAAAPVVLHGKLAEFVVLGVTLIGLLAIDQLHDVDRGQALQIGFLLALLGREFGVGDEEQRVEQGLAEPVGFLEVIGRHAGAGGILDVFLAGEDFRHVARDLAAGAEQVHLEDQRVLRAAIIEQMLQRRVGDQAAIPVVVFADADHGQGRRQGAAGHDMFRSDFDIRIVEIGEIGGLDIDRADRETDSTGIDEFEVNQFFQGSMQRRGIIERGCGSGPALGEPAIDRVRFEKARLAEQHGVHGRNGVAHFAGVVAFRPGQQRVVRGNGVPEFLEPFEPALRRVAGDDGGIDGADRDADHPIRFQPGLMQSLVDAGLIGAERAAALQNQADPIAALRPGHGLDRAVGFSKRGSGVV